MTHTIWTAKLTRFGFARAFCRPLLVLTEKIHGFMEKWRRLAVCETGIQARLIARNVPINETGSIHPVGTDRVGLPQQNLIMGRLPFTIEMMNFVVKITRFQDMKTNVIK